MLPVDEQRQARAARELIHAVGGIEAAAEIVGKGKSQVGRYQSPNEPDSMPVRDVELLEGVSHGKAGHPAMTRYLAARAGYVLVRLPDVRASGTDLLDFVARQAKESGDITSGLIDALRDGNVGPVEARALRAEISQLIEVAVAMDAELALLAEASHG